MSGGDWRGLELAVSRLLLHCGWSNVQIVGETGDKGADILAARSNPTEGQEAEGYIIQVEAVSGSKCIGTSAIDQVLQGQAHYGASVAVVATNGEFTHSAYKRRDSLLAQGFRLKLWNGTFLRALLHKWPEYSPGRRNLREYQKNIADLVEERHKAGATKALFVIATGLGKTVIAASVADHLYQRGLKRILVLCHTVDLANQLQQAFWAQIPKSIPTRLFMSGEPPVPQPGINFGLYQTLYGYLGGLDHHYHDCGAQRHRRTSGQGHPGPFRWREGLLSRGGPHGLGP